ncbi:hypothetical protein HRG_013402 [Hirsutella rhossiliensis]
MLLVDVELFGGDPPKPVKLPYPHKRPAEGEAQNESTSVLSREYLSCIPCEINPCNRCYVGLRVAALLFSSPAMRMCDQRYLKSSGLSYVAVSRVKTLQGLMLDAPFDRNHLTYASPPEGIKMKMKDQQLRKRQVLTQNPYKIGDGST